MVEEGVIPGTILFEGTGDANGNLQGIAYVFAYGCPPFGYRVAGHSNEGGRVIELHGAAPTVYYGCQVLGYSWATPNAHLFFSRVDR